MTAFIIGGVGLRTDGLLPTRTEEEFERDLFREARGEFEGQPTKARFANQPHHAEDAGPSDATGAFKCESTASWGQHTENRERKPTL